jgi:hypothetical protein
MSGYARFTERGEPDTAWYSPSVRDRSGHERIPSRVKLGLCAHPCLAWLLAATLAGLSWLAIGHWIRGG